MYVLKKGQMFSCAGLEKHWVVVTTNCVVKKDGSLVMGAGAALDLCNYDPEAPKIFGSMISYHDFILANSPRGKIKYGCKFYDEKRLGIFQTKYHYKDSSVIDLIEYSANVLKNFAISRHNDIFNLNYPGIGYGGLDKDDVHDVIRMLPENVHVWVK